MAIVLIYFIESAVHMDVALHDTSVLWDSSLTFVKLSWEVRIKLYKIYKLSLFRHFFVSHTHTHTLVYTGILYTVYIIVWQPYTIKCGQTTATRNPA